MRRGMTLIPRLFSHWWEVLEQPHHLFDQHFGRGLRPNQFFSSVFERPPFKSFPYSYYRLLMNWERDEECGQSIMKNDKDRFRIILDVQQFKPEEVGVKVVDNFIIVEGKHEDRADNHGLTSRHFVKTYLVPDQCDPERVTSTLSTDGILIITAPLKPETVERKREKTIKIEQTGKAMEDDELLKIKQKQ